MLYQRFAFLFLASVGLAACQGSVNGSSGSNETGGGGSGSGGSGAAGGTGQGGDGGSTSTTSSTSTSTAPVCEAPPGVGKFELGTGEKCFASLAAGDEIPLMAGPQGGYHVWLAAGCTDCGTVVHLKYGVRDPATNMPLTGSYNEESMVELTGADWPQRAGILVHMPGLSWSPETDPPPAKGSQVLLWLEAYTPKGDLWHQAQVLVTIGDTLAWDPCVENPNDPLCQTG